MTRAEHTARMEMMNWEVFLKNITYHLEDRYLSEGNIKTDLEGVGRENLDWIDCKENTEQWRFLVHIKKKFVEWVSESDSLVLYLIKSHVTKQAQRRPDKGLIHGAMAKSAFPVQALSHNCEKRLLASSSLYALRPSICPYEKLGYHWTDCQETWHMRIFRKSVEKTQVSLSLARIMGTSHEDLCTCVIIPRWILLRMGHASDKSCGKNQNGHFTFNTVFFRESCRLWDNVKKKIW